MTIIILLYLYRRQLKSQWARLGTPRQPLDSDNDPTSSDLTTTDFERGAMLPPESASLDLSESMFDNRGKYDSNVEPQRSKHLSTSATKTSDLIMANKKQSLYH